MEIKQIAKEVNAIAHEKGFWDKGIDVPQKLMLIVSELAEAMEADRTGLIADDVDTTKYLHMKAMADSNFTTFFESWYKNTYEDELADVAIRLFDLAEEQGID